MSRLVFDVETTKIQNKVKKVERMHMIVTEDFNLGTIMAYHDTPGLVPQNGSLEEGLSALEDADVIAGHNIKNFDVPVLKDLGGYVPHKGQRALDTIVMSRSLYPERWEHSIESWAKTLKMKEQKIQNDQWEVPTQLMLDRCISDVRINTQILRYFLKATNEHAQQGTNWMSCFNREMEVAEIHAEQTSVGVMYDLPLALETLKMFDEKLLSLKDIIMRDAPPVMDIPNVTGPKRIEFTDPESEGFPGVINPFKKIIHKEIKKPFKKNGELTAQARNVFETDIDGACTVQGPFSIYKKITPHDKYGNHTVNWFISSRGETHILETVKGPHCKVNFRPMNPNSDPEIKKFLYTLGWKPDEWNMKKLPGGGVKRNSPKISESSFGSLPPGLGQTIKTFRTLKHRRGLIQSPKNPETAGAISKMRDDGRVQASAITCGTPTARYTHSGAVCNIPRPSSSYGEEVRRLYRVPVGHWMVGVDLSGIEARMLAHGCFNFPGGREFARLVTTKADGGWHQKNAELWNCSRDDAKEELYALMFGAGGQKLGNILGRSAAEGLQNKKDFMEAYKPYAMLGAQLEAEYKKNDGWILGLDGRRLYVRTKKDCLNTYTQGNSAILFKEWMIRLRRARINSTNRIEQIIAYHDETQNEVYCSDKGMAQIFGVKCEQLATEVGEYFGLNVPVNAEAKVGMNWAECH